MGESKMGFGSFGLRPAGALALLVGGGLARVASGGVALTNDLAVLSLDRSGRVVSLVERETGRELAGAPTPFVCAEGRTLDVPESCEALDAGRIRFRFPQSRGGGEIVLRVGSFGPGWEVEFEKADLPAATASVFGQVRPALTKYRGRLANMYSDDRSGVCVRSYTAEGVMRCHGGVLSVRIPAKYGWAGRKFGLVAGARKTLVPALRRLTEMARAPRTDNGGAWSLGSEANRGSYLFADLHAFAADDWIDLALRGGFDAIHLHAWWASRGHYAVNPALFPGGEADWKRVADRIHAAGLKVGMHTLTAGIQPRDAWVSGARCERDFIDWCTHTLARPFGDGDDEIVVEEMPEPHHHTFHSFGSHGNTLRIEDEAVTYSGIRRERPYAFTGVTRGAFGRQVRGPYPAGTKVHYLFQRYDAFYPKPESELMDKLARAIAHARDVGDIDQIYLDGAEAMTWLDAQVDDLHRQRIVPYLPAKMLIEGSNGDAFTWWYLSRYGAWDRPYWGVKRMHDQHLRDVHVARVCNLLEPQMGWWNPLVGNERYRGHMLDEMEYFAAKNAGLDAPMSIQGVDAARPLGHSVLRQMTLLGWYERFRLARAFSDEAQALLARPRAETRLRLDAEGVWRLAPVETFVHRVTGLEDGSGRWRIDVPSAVAGALRVEALPYAAEAAGTNAVPLLTAADFGRMTAWRPPDRKIDFSVSVGADPARGPTLRLKATNRRATARGACAYAERTWTEQPFFSLRGRQAFGVWIRGDGKGAVLAIEIATPHLYHLARSPHLVKLDFTGWRRFTFLLREREAREAYGHDWPYGINPMIVCATVLDVEHVDNVRLALNELPPGAETEVEISEMQALPVAWNASRDMALTVNGADVALPFGLAGGEYAELEDGAWRRHSVAGDLLQVAPGPRLELKAGANELSYRGTGSDGGPSRIEATVFAVGAGRPALKPRATWTDAQRRSLAYEAVMPSTYAPSRGVVDLEPIVVRAGEKARVELTVDGPVNRPTLNAYGERWTFDVRVARGHRLYCRDGRDWCVKDARRNVVASGRLARALPVLSGRTAFDVTCADPASADARLDFVKRQVEDLPTYFEEHEVRVRSSLDGTSQPSYFFPAAARPGEKAPLLVFFHTWSYGLSRTDVYHDALKACRARGWSLLCPDFRGPNDTPQGCGSDLAVQDVADAVAWAKANFPTDDDRVYAMGASGGGHMALLMAGRHPGLWAGCAAFCPPADLLKWHAASRALGHDYWRQLERACGGSPDVRRAEYLRRSPVSHLRKAKEANVNVMLVTGIHDGHRGKGSVPVSQAIDCYNLLARDGDGISAETAAFVTENEAVPPAERFRGADPFYGDDHPVLLRRTSGNVQLTIFEGAHGGNAQAALDWLARQRRGKPADWSLPREGDSSYADIAK